MARYGRVLAFKHPLEESIHVICPEWGHQSTHLIDHAAERPNVRLQIIGLIFPHLWWGVVGRAGLGIEKTFFGNFGDIQVA